LERDYADKEERGSDEEGAGISRIVLEERLSRLLSILEEEYEDEDDDESVVQDEIIDRDDNETELDRGADEVLKEILMLMVQVMLPITDIS